MRLVEKDTRHFRWLLVGIAIGSLLLIGLVMKPKPPRNFVPVTITVNGFTISTYDGSGMINAFMAKWKSRPFAIFARRPEDIPRDHATLAGILEMVRHTHHNKQPSRHHCEQWPKGTSVQGVTRGDDLDSFRQAHYVIESPIGVAYLEIFEPIPEAEMNDFFSKMIVNTEGFWFDIDAESDHRKESKLYPDPSELP